jgi:hypothetical protein
LLWSRRHVSIPPLPEAEPSASADQALIDADEAKLDDTCWVFAFEDDDQNRVEIPRYKVQTVWLPNWLLPERWIPQHLQWHWAWSFGVDPLWPQPWQEWFAYHERGERDRIGWAGRLEAIRLLRTVTFKSEFRRQMRNRITEWLDTHPVERKYDSPLSPRQWQAVVQPHTSRISGQFEKEIYHSDRYRDILGAPAQMAIAVPPSIPLVIPAEAMT